MHIADQIEEADVGLCADGFDNFVMYDDLEELEQHSTNLKTVGATRCAKVIDDLLKWIASRPEDPPLSILENDEGKTTELWNRYNDASCSEDPQKLAKAHKPRPKPKMPITDRDHYLFYGDENSERPCKVEGCDRGSVKLSVHCRSHHFEKVMRKPCPWND